jgi:threonine dehydratase
MPTNSTISVRAVEEARKAIASTAIRTPLIQLNVPNTPAEIYLKLENLQPIGSFKIRGAANAISRLPLEKLERGVVTASAGNMAQGVAWMARLSGIPCTVIAPDTAPEIKTKAVERLGGRVIKVPFEDWWRAFEERSFPGCDGTFIHSFDDKDVMAGNGTIALEILEDLPDVDAVVIPWGGGGLTCGIASALRQLRPATKIFAAEVSTSGPLAHSLAAGTPVQVDYQPSFIDGIGSRTVFPRMFDLARQLIDGSLIVELSAVTEALKLLVEYNRVVAEGAGATPVACALSGQAGSGKIVCVVSGGNIDPAKLAAVLTS